MREALDAVAPSAIVEHRGLPGQRLEEPLCQPPLEERVDPVPLELLGLPLVGRQPGLACPRDAIPGEPLTSTSADTTLGLSSASRRHRRAPIE